MNRKNIAVLLFVLILSVVCAGVAGSQSETADGWGYIDRNGDFVIDAQYTEAGPFSCGLAPVALEFPAPEDSEASSVDLYGYIDRSGHTVIPHAYYDAEPFNDKGYAIVRSSSGRYGIIDTCGDVVCDFIYDSLYYWPETDAYRGMITSFADKALKYETTVFSLDGTVCFVPQDLTVAERSSAYYTARNSNGQYAIIDLQGNPVTPFMYDRLQILDSDTLRFEKDGKNGLMSPDGTVLLDPQYQEVSNIYDGKVVVRKDNEYCLVTLDGTVLRKYDNIDFIVKTVVDGKVAVFRGTVSDDRTYTTEGVWSLMDLDGNILSGQYDGEFLEIGDTGCFFSSAGNRLTYCVDLQGNETLHDVEGFLRHTVSADLYLLQKEDGYFLIDSEGNEIPNIHYLEMFDAGEGFFGVQYLSWFNEAEDG